jgi:hypothetical protein
MSQWLSAHVPSLVLWIGGFCTLALYSLLYKENKIYRLAEHVYLGLATGYLVATSWTDVLLPKWWKPMVDQGQWWQVGLLLVGLMYYFIFFERHAWIARLVIGFFLGVTSGRAFQEFANDIWPQIPATFKPILPHAAVAASAGHPAIPALGWSGALNNLIFMVIVLCVASYFFFSFEQKHRLLKGSAQWGRWMMMFTFGAIFGSTVMGRLALLIDRVDFLLNDFGAAVAGPRFGPLILFTVLMALTALVVFLAVRQGNEDQERPE